MDPDVKQAISHAVETEPLATLFRMRLVDLDTGFSKVEMACKPENRFRFFKITFSRRDAEAQRKD